MPNTFSADDVVGKVLSVRAGASAKVKSVPYDDQPVLYTVAGGNPVGVVYGWVPPAEGRRSTWWQIEKPGGGYVWVEHLTGVFDVKKLEQQGVVTNESKEWDDKGFFEKLTIIGTYVLAGWGLILIIQMNERKNGDITE